VVTQGNLKKFDNNLSRIVATKFRTEQAESTHLDKVLATQAKEANDIERAADILQEALIMSCNQSFKKRSETKKTKYKSVAWWTDELTITRKRINALRKYQGTTNNDYLRERRKNQYNDEKSQYQAAIKRERIKPWKEFCNLTSATNPWNALYKIASNKAKRSQFLSTLQKPDGTLTTDINETITYMLDYLIAKDDEDKDSDYHNTIRAQIEIPIQTADDREYTPEETRTAIEILKSKKAPGEDGITSEILQRAYKQFPSFIHTIYNQCLRQGCFPKRWKGPR
jgi:hypothetical protein